MSELKKIEAPALSPEYGDNIDKTFDNIQENFDVLANQELYRGESGTNLITVNLSWQTIFDTPAGTPIEVIVGGVEPKTYYILNFGPAIRSSLNTLSQGSEEDTAAAIDGLKNSGCITVCFADVETTIDTPTQVLSAIPFVFIDMRFRSTADYSELSGRTDMSCVIMYADGWECVQSFPTLYYNEGNLYWKINGQNTSILAQGPAGKDGSTGTVYVGLSNDLKINDVTTGSSVIQINIKYLLQYQIISPSSSGYEDLEEDSQSHLPFVTIVDWIKINNSNPINGAPVIVMGEDQAPVTYNSNLGVPYYISELIYNESDNTCTCNVSKYNICYAHMNDNTVKRAIMNNVLTLPQSMPGGLGQNELPGYSIKERAEQTSGYSIFAPYGTTYKELVISYVSDINNPSPGYNSIKSKFRIVGSLAEGENTEATGESSHAEGYAVGRGVIRASDMGAHAEGCSFDQSTIHAANDGAHAEGYAVHNSNIESSGMGSHVEGYAVGQGVIRAANDGAHAEGYTTNIGNIESSGMGSHAEGYSVDQSTIHADNDGAHVEGYAAHSGSIESSGEGSHAEGYVEGANKYIRASGKGSHAEGYMDGQTPGSIEATGKGAHAEGSGTTASGDYSHAEGYRTEASRLTSHAEGSETEASGDYSHAEGYISKASGLASHAEGLAIASGDYSHAEGYHTLAEGNYSHAGGYKTTASKDYSVAMGQFNAEGYLWVSSNGMGIIANYYDEEGTITVDGTTYTPSGTGGSINWQQVVFSYGIGSSTEFRFNAFMITRSYYPSTSMTLVYSRNVGQGGIATRSNPTNVTIYKKL